MKRLYLFTEDPVISRMAEWLTERLEHDAIRVMDESQADVAVFSYESEDFETRCNALSSAGCTVFVLTPETKGALAQRIIRAGGKTITFRQPEDAILVLQRLTEILVSPPVPDKKEVVAIYSAKQAGGSFVAWNLWITLLKLGKKASLCSVTDEGSPFRGWLPDAPVYFGGHEGREEDNIWIVDATGFSEVIDGEADLTLVVYDADPSKLIPDIDGEKIANRIWPDVSSPDLYIPDLGQLAIRGMHTHQAVVELDESAFRLFAGLWRYWHGETIEPSFAEIDRIAPAKGEEPSVPVGKGGSDNHSESAGATDRLPTHPIEGGLPSAAPNNPGGLEHKDSQQEEKTGFSFDDEVPPTGTTTVGGSDIGFQFDE